MVEQYPGGGPRHGEQKVERQVQVVSQMRAAVADRARNDRLGLHSTGPLVCRVLGTQN